MLLTVLRNHRDFELVQAYLAAFLKINRNKLWVSCIKDDDLDRTLGEVNDELKKSWEEIDRLMLHNATLLQWIKTALL